MGPRRALCLGVELATAEVYLALGRLFSPASGLELQLYDTSYEEDVLPYHDYFSPFAKSLKGIRIVVS